MWIELSGFEGRYLISDAGRIWSLLTHREISQHIVSPGYLGVSLYDGVRPRPRVYRVHKLVASAFLGPCPDGMEVCHGINGMLDNSLSNIRYGTRADNISDKPKKNRMRLSRSIVNDIKNRYASGNTYESISRDMGIPYWTVLRVLRRGSYKDF